MALPRPGPHFFRAGPNPRYRGADGFTRFATDASGGAQAMTEPARPPLALVCRQSGDPARTEALGPYAIEALLTEAEEGAGTVYCRNDAFTASSR